MAKRMNPPKKNKYPQIKPKKKSFFEKHEKGIRIAAIAAAIAVFVCAAVAVFLWFFLPHTPYDGMRTGKYARLPDYKSLEISEKTVSDEMESEKKAFLKQYASYPEKTSGKIAEGDNVTINTKGYYYENEVRGNEIYSGGALTDYEVTDVGNHITESGAPFSPEVQTALIGADVSVGSVTALIEYSDDYSDAIFRGKTVEYVVTITKVTETVLPDYTDEFVKEKTGLSGIAEYEEQIKKEIEENILWNTLTEKTEIKKYPKSKIGYYSDEFDDYYTSYMNNYGLSFSELLSEVLGTDQSGYDAQKQSYAEGTVKEELILYGIVMKERIKIKKSEYEEKCKEYADANGYETVSELLADYPEEFVKRMIYWEKVKTVLRNNAVYTA